MAQDDDEENLVFNVEEVQKIVRDNIEMCLGGNTYSHSRVPQWITVITEKTLARLNKLNKPFKYLTFREYYQPDYLPPTLRIGIPDITYDTTYVRHWVRAQNFFMISGSNYLHETCIKSKLQQVRITITQKNGTGLHTAAAYFWDTATDGTCTVRWENKFMYCIINIWGLALQI